MKAAPESTKNIPTCRRGFLETEDTQLPHSTEYYDDDIWADDPEWADRRLEAMRNVSSIEEIFEATQPALDCIKPLRVCEWVFADLVDAKNS